MYIHDSDAKQTQTAKYANKPVKYIYNINACAITLLNTAAFAVNVMRSSEQFSCEWSYLLPNYVSLALRFSRFVFQLLVKFACNAVCNFFRIFFLSFALLCGNNIIFFRFLRTKAQKEEEMNAMKICIVSFCMQSTRRKSCAWVNKKSVFLLFHHQDKSARLPTHTSRENPLNCA